MLDMILRIYDSFSDSTKRFEDRILSATQLLGQCHTQWFLDLSRALHPLMVFGDFQKTFDLYSAFLYEQAQYHLPAGQAISMIHEAESRMTDQQTRCAMVRLRLGTFLVFRWLDMGYPSSGRNYCSFCYTPHMARQNFGKDIQNTWALLKQGNDYFIKSAMPLEDFLRTDGKIVLPGGPNISVEETRSFLRNQLDAINSLLLEMSKDIGIISARSDFLRGIDLKKPKTPATILKELEEQDDSGTKIFRLIAQADATWKVGLLTEYQESLTLGVSEPTGFLY